jgi:hypothetical protein
MTIPSNNKAIVVFGSAARRDFDRMSDKDVLVVDDDRQALHSAQQTFKCFGWSPVCFTWNRLERAVSQKGLFIQHLKIEGSVICDGQNRFRELMSQFSVRSIYCHEIAQSCELLHVLDEIPDSQAGRYWAVDVMHVGLRSLGVTMLANHGIYRFSLSGILDGLREIGIFSSSDTEKLRIIREFKWRYRARQFERPLGISEVCNLADLVSQRFRLDLNVCAVKPEVAIANALDDGGLNSNWYLRSRTLERALLSLSPQREGDRDLASMRKDLFDLIKEPSQYGWQIKHHWRHLRDRLSVLAGESDAPFAPPALIS